MAHDIVDAGFVLAHMNDMPIVDVRTPEEYYRGHIPNAVNVDLLEAQKADSHGASEMARMVKEKGINPDTEFIIHCRSGRKAGVATGLLEHEGFSHIHIYRGSWLDWTDDPDRPIEK